MRKALILIFVAVIVGCFAGGSSQGLGVTTESIYESSTWKEAVKFVRDMGASHHRETWSTKASPQSTVIGETANEQVVAKASSLMAVVPEPASDDNDGDYSVFAATAPSMR
jgi:hypothetical protein